MWKSRILLISFFFFTLALTAQQKLEVEGVSPDLYLLHKVQPRETWYSLGRLYNVNPKALVQYNHTDMSKPLYIGQEVHVPVTADNFSQDGRRSADEVFVPLYHTVQPKEWMYRISVNHFKVPIENLEKWNGITNNQLRPGMAIIVGYLKVKSGLSALAGQGVKNMGVAANAPAEAAPAKEQAPPSLPAEKPNPPAGNPVVKRDPPAGNSADSGSASERSEHKAPPEANPPATSASNAPATTTPVYEPSANINFKGGYFRSQYHKGDHSLSGNAGIFRSTSGWQDGKYYALMNDVPIGTIIKVTFSSTQKSVYAKVLGGLPDMKESIGLSIRLSDAAASELGAGLNKFYVDISY